MSEYEDGLFAVRSYFRSRTGLLQLMPSVIFDKNDFSWIEKDKYCMGGGCFVCRYGSSILALEQIYRSKLWYFTHSPSPMKG